MSQLDTLEQLQIFDEFKLTHDDLSKIESGQADPERFGALTREGKTLYRYRSNEHRFYFEVSDNNIVVHRVLHKGSLNDFFYRTKLPNLAAAEDEQLAQSKQFWHLIDEGKNAQGKN